MYQVARGGKSAGEYRPASNTLPSVVLLSYLRRGDAIMLVNMFM